MIYKVLFGHFKDDPYFMTDEEEQRLLERDRIEEEEMTKNPHAQALGKLGGLKGGKARAEKLTPEQRLEISRKAAAASAKVRKANKEEGK